MRRPVIRTCINNHIYDSTLYTECPYCRKLREDGSGIRTDVSGTQADGTRTEKPLPYQNSGQENGDGDEPTKFLWHQ